MSSSPPPSSPEPPFVAELVEEPSERSRKRWRGLGIGIALVALIVLVVLGVAYFPIEAQKWRIAAAEERRLDGDLDGALSQLEENLARDPDDLELRQKRAMWLYEKKDFDEALREVERILTADPDHINALQMKAQLLQSQQKFAEAVEMWKQIAEMDEVASGPRRAESLNGLAYARALANVEIQEGLANINEAMRITGENYPMLDTRGYLYYRSGDLNRALNDLENAVLFAEAAFEQSQGSLFVVPDARQKKQQERYGAQTVAVIRYHRSLVHQARKDSEQAKVDRDRIRELGFEPDESLF